MQHPDRSEFPADLFSDPHAAKNADVISDVVPPGKMVSTIVEEAVKKESFRTLDILIRGFLCTPFLAYATTLCALLITQGWPSAAAGLLFPVGYVMLSFLGLEMATGSFSVMPIGAFAGRVGIASLGRNWIWTFIGNLIGGIFFAGLLWFALTKGGVIPPDGVLATLSHIAEKKIAYEHYGVSGWFAAVAMGVLCNWLVSLAPIIAKASKSVVGKVLLMWLPIATFFAIGFEHSVVNMFVFPIAIFSGVPITVDEWWIWNQIPVTLGNILGAVVFNAGLWNFTHRQQAQY